VLQRSGTSGKVVRTSPELPLADLKLATENQCFKYNQIQYALLGVVDDNHNRCFAVRSGWGRRRNSGATRTLVLGTGLRF
jgi:hypothetical protein